MTCEYYAHSLEGRPPSEWQPLKEHLGNVAQLAAEFARPFGGDNWSWQSGDKHDAGKGTLSWQAYLHDANEMEDDCKQKQWDSGNVPHYGTCCRNTSSKWG